jgi:hypothetical protein
MGSRRPVWILALCALAVIAAVAGTMAVVVVVGLVAGPSVIHAGMGPDALAVTPDARPGVRATGQAMPTRNTTPVPADNHGTGRA